MVVDCDVPFSGVAGGVAVCLHRAGEGKGVGRHASAIPRVHHSFVRGTCVGRMATDDVSFLSTCGVVSAHDGAAGWRAGWGG